MHETSGFESLYSGQFILSIHREQIILLSRERANKGTKRMNSLPLSPLVISFILHDFTGKTAAFQILHNTEALNSYLGLSMLSKFPFWLV